MAIKNKTNRLFNVRYIIVFYFIFIQLVGCSSTAVTPAPVTSVEGYQADLKASINTATYRVKKGETLYSIAWRTNQDFKHLAALNNIQDPYHIFPGQVLTTKGQLPKSRIKKEKTASLHNTSSSARAPIVTTGSTSKKGTVSHIAKPEKKAYSKNTLTNSKQSKTGTAGTNTGVKAKSEVQAKVKPKVKPKPTAKPAPPKVKNNRSLRWRWPAGGRVVKTFSTSQIGHKGLNISGKRGQSVVAAESGRVVYAGNGLRGYGNLIIIKHNDDYLSAYAYNQNILVKEKQWVKAGQKIANMGSSGSDSSVALYFEIRYRGKPVNPNRYLPKR